MPETLSLIRQGNLTSGHVRQIKARFQTPFYIIVEKILNNQCDQVLDMPNAFGLFVRYAMKANSDAEVLRTVRGRGLGLDVSSMNEARRAHMAGIPYSVMMLTTQEVPEGEDRRDLEKMMLEGLVYNVCSLLQLKLIAPFASRNRIPLSMRVHPGRGSGESQTRNTGDKYSCFGIHLTDLIYTLKYAREKGVVFDTVHTHIGSGGDPKVWRANIDRQLGFVENYFLARKFQQPIARVNFGGGIKEGRMPDDTRADIQDLGKYAKKRIEKFATKTGRRLTMEIEPGTFVVANAGYGVTKIKDIKKTGKDGFLFYVLDGGMEFCTRPLLYGSKHPFYVVSKEGKILSSENNLEENPLVLPVIPVGICCESGDSWSLDEQGHIVPRLMARANIGDYVIVGGLGAYAESMTPFNYNSHTQAPAFMLKLDGRLYMIRRPQTLKQVIQNETCVALNDIDF